MGKPWAVGRKPVIKRSQMEQELSPQYGLDFLENIGLQELKELYKKDKFTPVNMDEEPVPEVNFDEIEEDAETPVSVEQDRAELTEFEQEIKKTEEIPTIVNKIEMEGVPKYTDPEWNDYVLSQFVDEELYNENPTVDGLRRVTELLCGEIIHSATQIVQTPDENNGRRATAVVTVVIHPRYSGGMPRTYSGSADAFPGNLQDLVADNPVAMAETRAEGRALRRALRLRNVVAEELKNSPPQLDEVRESTAIGAINTNQINCINMLAANTQRGVNINVVKMIELMVTHDTLKSATKLSETDATKILNMISNYQADKNNIPMDIRGYDPDWTKNI